VLSKANLLITQHNEQLFKLERELITTKDVLKSLTIKLDLHINETNNKFGDYELAIADLEKNIPVYSLENNEIVAANENNEDIEEDLETIEEDFEENADKLNVNNVKTIMSVDLKNIIKQELANDNSI